ncbi:thyrotropin subunit beta [Sardina pilchardus]|uniref:thyrotropin subunit beta n=1 Tax=Sardina pilchardus TaxID=27697 RepID=UPI002E10EE5F
MQKVGLTLLTNSIFCLQFGVLLGCGCSLTNITLYVNMHECGHCMAVNTTICSGLCHTQDTNLRGFVGKHYLIQRGCVQRSVDYQATKMPGCPTGTDPLFFYPVARQCHCAKCNTRRMECVHVTKRNSHRCSKRLRPV